MVKQHSNRCPIERWLNAKAVCVAFLASLLVVQPLQSACVFLAFSTLATGGDSVPDESEESEEQESVEANALHLVRRVTAVGPSVQSIAVTYLPRIATTFDLDGTLHFSSAIQRDFPLRC